MSVDFAEEASFALCGCAACCDERAKAAILASDVGADATALSGKPSYDVATAATQIGRNNLVWGDGSLADGSGLGTPGEVRYGYLASPGESGAVALTAAEIENVEWAIQALEDVANLNSVRVQDAGSAYVSSADAVEMDIAGLADTNGGWASWNWSGGEFRSATVRIGEYDLESVGEWAFKTALHEIGHGIGLLHPSAYNGANDGYAVEALYAEDTAQFSVMSYFSETETGADYGDGWAWIDGGWTRVPEHATGLMLHDIAAVQRLYGANMTTRTGESVYGFNSNLNDRTWSFSAWHDVAIAAIWDAGGIDTIDASGYMVDAVIDLRETAFSSIGGQTHATSTGTGMINNVAIAAGVKIENAIGGQGDDLLIGNAADATHQDAGGTGYAGDNVLDGRAGVDTVSYADAVAHGASSPGRGVIVDLALTGAQDLGDNGQDTLISIENLIGSAFEDDVFGTIGTNVLEGGGGADLLEGRAGDDLLDGGDGDDTLVGGDGADQLRGGAGDDLLIADTFADPDPAMESFERLMQSDAFLARFAGALVMNGGLTSRRVAGEGGGNDWLYGGTGNDILDGGGADDWLTGGEGDDIFVFARGGGVDQVADFRVANDLDRLDLTSFGILRWANVSAKAQIEVVGTETTFDFGDGDRLTITGFTPDTAADDMFVFA